MERYHIYKLGLAILFYVIYCGRQALVNGLKIDDGTSTSDTTDFRERRDAGDTYYYQDSDGTPGVDYPTLSYVPKTKFSCREMEAGYYADLDTDCQVFHICDEGRKLSFLCPNGTIFRQADLICDWWFKVNCTTSPLLYEESAEILQRENAKRKGQRRIYQGTKQGVFSSKEDYDYRGESNRVTPGYFVTPSYQYRSTSTGVDNRIITNTEKSARKNYNTRTDRKLDSFGNGVRESRPRDADTKSDNTFERNFGQSQTRTGQVSFEQSNQNAHQNKQNNFNANTEQTSKYTGQNNLNFNGFGSQRTTSNFRENSFSNRDQNDSQFKQSSSARGQIRFNDNSQLRFSTTEKIPFNNANSGNTQTSFSNSQFDGKASLDASNDDKIVSQIHFNKNNLNKQQQYSFSTTDFQADSFKKSDVSSVVDNSQRNNVNEPSFNKNGLNFASFQQKQDEHSHDTHFNSRYNGFSATTTTSPFRFGFNAPSTTTTINPFKFNYNAPDNAQTKSFYATTISPFKSNHNVQFNAGARSFSTATTARPFKQFTEQNVLNYSGSNVPSGNEVQQRRNNFEQSFSKESPNKNFNSAGATVAPVNYQNENRPFSTSLSQKLDFLFSTTTASKPTFAFSTKAPTLQRENKKIDLNFKGDLETEPERGHKDDALPLINAHEKIKFSINSFNSAGKFGKDPGADFNAESQGTFEGNAQTVRGKSSTTESNAPFVSSTSEETQELQETASFVKNTRNHLQTTTKFYPNHRETYSEIKDPKRYYEKSFSTLPEKPFYGSSTSPQVLSTVPVSLKTSKLGVTTEKTATTYRGSFVNNAAGVTETVPLNFDTTVRPSNSVDKGFYQSNAGLVSGNFQIGTTKARNDISSFTKLANELKVTLSHARENQTPTGAPVYSAKNNDVDFNLNFAPSTLPSQSVRQNQASVSYATTPSVARSSKSYLNEPTRADSPIVKLNILPATLSTRPSFDDVISNSPQIHNCNLTHTTPANAPEGGNVVSLNALNSDDRRLTDSPFVRVITSTPPTVNPNVVGFTTTADLSPVTSVKNYESNKYENRIKQVLLSSTSATKYVNNRLPSSPSPFKNTPSSSALKETNHKLNDETTTEISAGFGTLTTQNIYSRDEEKLRASPTEAFKDATTVRTPLKYETATQSIPFAHLSTVLQPKPFSAPNEESLNTLNVVSLSLDAPPEYPSYQLSSASPFVSSYGKINSVRPTLPTPFTTASTYTREENLNNMIHTLMEVVRNQLGSSADDDFGTPRPGLLIPPSVGPKTLHSLAVYFANNLDNVTSLNASEHSDRASADLKQYAHNDNDELIRSLLTQMTRENYDNLFKEKDHGVSDEDVNLSNGAKESDNDLLKADTKYTSEGPEVRQLARVFTEALSAYLEDPDTFRKVLYSVRPKEPLIPFSEVNEADEDEVLNYSDTDLKVDHPQLSTRPTTAPINPTWGYILAYNKTDDVQDNSVAAEVENLQSADSQSFVSHFNNVASDPKDADTAVRFDLNKNLEGTTITTTDATYTETETAESSKDLPDNHWTTSSDVAKLWQTTLSVNPATLNENFDSTNQEEEEADTSGTQYYGVPSSEETSSETISEIQYELRALPKIELNSTQVHGILIDFMNANKTDGAAKLQRILNKLNITQEEFLVKMKEIEKNPLTRRLILLLISECNADLNKQLEPRSPSYDARLGPRDINENVFAATTIRPETETPVTESNVFRRIVDPSLDNDDEDTRALELLNSLYVIASKFGK